MYRVLVDDLHMFYVLLVYFHGIQDIYIPFHTKYNWFLFSAHQMHVHNMRNITDAGISL